jgi:miniconductance mechanosensitive channel
MNTKLLFDISSLLEKNGIAQDIIPLLNMLYGLMLIFLSAWIADLITRKLVLRALKSLAKKTTSNWDDILLEKRVFNRLSHLVPAIILFYMIGIVLADYQQLLSFARSLINVYMIIMVLMAINSIINAIHEIYQNYKIAIERPIKGYVQVIKIIFYFIAVILILSVILNKKPTALFAGLGAMAAVFMLVFKDTILGFVASIQLSANDMVKIGDWVSMPSRNADGNVLEVTLNTVKIQNFDKTISTIPTYALVSESFNNWRGMEESGGRRIKRHINIDMKSVKFCNPEMLEKFKKIIYIKDYIENKQKEIAEYNLVNNIDESILVNGRRMTNFGTFRYYLEEYLKHHPKIHKELTLLVRHLQPTEKGIPIEIYFFSNVQDWANYEKIQADIFDHILAVIPEFELRVFQNPTGEDFKQLLN